MDPNPQQPCSRRELLASLAAATALPPLCCRSIEAERSSFRIAGSKVWLNVKQVGALRHVGGAVALIDAEHKLNVIVARVERDRYVALDRTCTHGGAMCTYNPKRQTLQCTSLNHAEYDLQGTLLHGRTHGNVRAHATRLLGQELEIEL